MLILNIFYNITSYKLQYVTKYIESKIIIDKINTHLCKMNTFFCCFRILNSQDIGILYIKWYLLYLFM